MKFLQELLEEGDEDVMDALKEGVEDRSLFNCNYTDYFDASVITRDPIRRSCFPAIADNFGYNPENKTTGDFMTTIDKENLIVSWNPDMNLFSKNDFDIRLNEFDVFGQKSASLSRKFSLTVVNSYETFIEGGETKMIDIETSSTTCLTISYECMSKRCPNFIFLKQSQKKLLVDGKRTRNSRSDGVYIYFLAYTDSSGIVTKHQAEIIHVNAVDELPENEIDINLPWDTWVKVNKDNLPYAVGKQRPQSK